MAVIDCIKEPMTGDCLADRDGVCLWKITGLVTHIKYDVKLKPYKYLNNKNMMRSIQIKPLMEKIMINKGEKYYLLRPPLII